MVCVPCFAIPAILIIFRLIIRPIVYRIWGYYMQEPALSCPLPRKKEISKKGDDISEHSKDACVSNDAHPEENDKDK